MTAGDDAGPAPWVTPEFEVITTGGAHVIAASGEAAATDDTSGPS